MQYVFTHPYADGVRNPYADQVHLYPTTVHGPDYSRPVFDFPYVLRPLHEDPEGLTGLGDQYFDACVAVAKQGCTSLFPGAATNPLDQIALDNCIAASQQKCAAQTAPPAETSWRALLATAGVVVAGATVGGMLTGPIFGDMILGQPHKIPSSEEQAHEVVTLVGAALGAALAALLVPSLLRKIAAKEAATPP